MRAGSKGGWVGTGFNAVARGEGGYWAIIRGLYDMWGCIGEKRSKSTHTIAIEAHARTNTHAHKRRPKPHDRTALDAWRPSSPPLTPSRKEMGGPEAEREEGAAAQAVRQGERQVAQAENK